MASSGVVVANRVAIERTFPGGSVFDAGGILRQCVGSNGCVVDPSRVAL